MIYILYSFHNNERLRIKTQIAEGERLRSACGLWPTANWLEREVFDMFGIEFEGHPELKRILMPDDWKGHPLRKDYGILQQDAGMGEDQHGHRERTIDPTINTPQARLVRLSRPRYQGQTLSSTPPNWSSTWDRSIRRRTACCASS